MVHGGQIRETVRCGRSVYSSMCHHPSRLYSSEPQNVGVRFCCAPTSLYPSIRLVVRVVDDAVVVCRSIRNIAIVLSAQFSKSHWPSFSDDKSVQLLITALSTVTVSVISLQQTLMYSLYFGHVLTFARFFLRFVSLFSLTQRLCTLFGVHKVV